MTTLVQPRVDAHLHVWDLARSRYGWLTPGHGPLYATFTPDDAAAELAGCGVGRAVLVQAEDSERDTELLLAAADRYEWIAGVVGWVRLEDPALAERQLDRWQGQPAFRGVRQLIHDDPRDGLLADPGVRASLRLVAARGLTFDVPDAWPRHLAATADLAGALPDLPIVLDHLGKPPFGGADWDAWRRALAAVAARANTVAKVSGLHVPGRPFTVEGLRPAWAAALELFGPERLMWGSDWPMTLLAAGYAGTWEVLAALVGELAPDEQRLLVGGTAGRVYRLAEKEP